MFNAKQCKNFAKLEEKILSFWSKNNIFEKTVLESKGREPFSFYDGPPFATGLPHYGHLLAGTIKDVIPRYKIMKGYSVERRFGWDCHGLPVENEIEKEKGIYGKKEIEKMGIDRFNNLCQGIVLRYTSQWEKTVQRMGRWVDFKHCYKTMDINFMESVWWVFKNLYEKDLIYEGFKVMPFSCRMGTALSNFEANLNYKDVDDPSVILEFPLVDSDNVFFLAWTTTPWTLVSNLALAVKKDGEYVKLWDKNKEKYYILAKERIEEFFKDGEYDVVETYSSADLKNLKYIPPFDYFIDNNAFFVIEADFVSFDEGTGIVHCAPAFGEDDFYACKEANIKLVCPLDNNGFFTDDIIAYKGLFIKDAEKKIIKDLKDKKLVFKHSQIRHRYPFCWRSDTPLIYKAVNSWFLNVEKIKDDLIDVNKQINWIPDHIKFGRFGKWLQQARDWAISRDRYWGTPMPIWRNEKGQIYVFGSIEELEAKVNVKISDLHRHHIDNITFEIDGLVYKRIEPVFDCWFESGSMPYAQNHYPFENENFIKDAFPADFIAEGLDQTRGWFYTLNVLSTALFNKPAFKNVIVNGIVLTEDGNKMSKRLKNYPEPMEVIDKYGADAIRLYLLSSPAVKAESFCFSQQGVQLVLRKILIPLWNSFYFFCTYAKIYDWQPSHDFTIKNVSADIDKWLLSICDKLIEKVEASMDKYDLNHAITPFIEFIDKLTNWYIRRSRQRFWDDEDSLDRRSAFFTLYHVLFKLCKVIAPFVPFIAEAMYLELKKANDPISVHLTSYPNPGYRNHVLEKKMDYIQRVVKMGHHVRKERSIKVRQPLLGITIIASTDDVLNILKQGKELIVDELNVKHIVFKREDVSTVEKIIKPNFPILGKKVGKLLPKIQKYLAALSIEEKNDLERKGFIYYKDNNIKIEKKDVVISKLLKDAYDMQDAELSIAFDFNITPELKKEALAREIVNKINNMRRDMGLEVTDRINVICDSTKVVRECFNDYKDYIVKEVLAINVIFSKVCNATDLDLNGENARIVINKATFKDD